MSAVVRAWSFGAVLVFAVAACDLGAPEMTAPAKAAQPAEKAEPAKPAIDASAVGPTYTLRATMQGFMGVGGDIDRKANPVLRAKKGETVTIKLINPDPMPHDLVFEVGGARTEMLGPGETETIQFVASTSDTYYCSVPGHRMIMQGKLEISGVAKPPAS